MPKGIKDILFILAVVAFIGGLVLINSFLNSYQTEEISKKDYSSDEKIENNLNQNITENSTDEGNANMETNGIIEVTDKTFKQEVLESSYTVLVDFYADWCTPCHMLAPTVEEVAKENPNIKVVKVNIDESEDLAIDYNVMSIPTLMVFEKGKMKQRVIGVVEKEYILDMIK